MVHELPLFAHEQKTDLKTPETAQSNLHTLRAKIGRIAAVTSLIISGTAATFSIEEVAQPVAAYADSLGYPYPTDTEAPCEFGSAGGTTCTDPTPTRTTAPQYTNQGSYNWGVTIGGVFHPYREAGGYQYRNCTDYTAWKLESLGVASSVVNGLGNGGNWYDNAPAAKKSLIPKAGEAAVVPPTAAHIYGHVAFIESVNSVDAVNPDNDNITISEYNYSTHGDGDYRTGRAVDLGFTKFVDFGVQTSGAPTGPVIQNQVSEVYTPNNGTVSLYAEGTNGQLTTWWQNSQGAAFSGPGSLGGSMASAPEAILSPNNNTVSVYAVGTNGQLETWWQNSQGAAFSGPTYLGGHITGQPSVVYSPANGTISVYAKDSVNGQLETWYQNSAGSAFSGPVSLGGNLTSAPVAIVSSNNNAVSIYAEGADGALQTWWQNSAGAAFSGPSSLGGALTATPSVVYSPANNTISVYGSGANGQLETWWQNSQGSPFSGPSYMGGSIVGTPDAILSPNNNTVSIYAEGNDGKLTTWWQNYAGSAFSGPSELAGGLDSAPTGLNSPANNTISLYGIKNSQLVTWWQNSTGSAFSGPGNLGGSVQ